MGTAAYLHAEVPAAGGPDIELPGSTSGVTGILDMGSLPPTLDLRASQRDAVDAVCQLHRVGAISSSMGSEHMADLAVVETVSNTRQPCAPLRECVSRSAMRTCAMARPACRSCQIVEVPVQQPQRRPHVSRSAQRSESASAPGVGPRSPSPVRLRQSGLAPL